MVVISNFPGLNSKLAVDLLAHDAALAVRGAQIDALNGLASKTRYGMHFDSSVGAVPSSPNNEKIIEFQDSPTAGVVGAYDSGEDVATSLFQRGDIIEKVCRKRIGESMMCGPATITTLDILFVRPSPDAIMNGNGRAAGETNYAEAAVLFSGSDATPEKCMHVYLTGQVSVTVAVAHSCQ